MRPARKARERAHTGSTATDEATPRPRDAAPAGCLTGLRGRDTGESNGLASLGLRLRAATFTHGYLTAQPGSADR